MTTYYTCELTGADLDLAVALALREQPELLDSLGCAAMALHPQWNPHTTVWRKDHYVGFGESDPDGAIWFIASGVDAHTRHMILKRYGIQVNDFWGPSRRAAQGHPILEAARIQLRPGPTTGWDAKHYTRQDGWVSYDCEGPTMLVAGLRHFVCRQFGDTIDLPTKE